MDSAASIDCIFTFFGFKLVTFQFLNLIWPSYRLVTGPQPWGLQLL